MLPETTDSNQEDSGLSQRLSRLVFRLGCAYFLFMQSSLFIVPLLVRHLPIEMDDSYHYILHAVFLESDLTGQPTAMHQVYDDIDRLPSSFAKSTIYGVRIQYTPLHSIALIATHRLGIGFDVAHIFVQILGGLAMLVGIVAFVRSIQSPGAAGITLFLMAAVLYPDHGLHVPVPGNMALGAAFWCWAAILGGWRHLTAVVCLCTAIACALHPFGVIWSGLTLLLFLLKRTDPQRRIPLAIFLILVMIGFSGYYRFGPWSLATIPMPESVLRASAVASRLTNILFCLKELWNWMNVQGFVSLPVLLSLGLFSILRTGRFRPYLLMLAPLGVMCIGGMLVQWYHYNCSFFNRVIPPLLLILTMLQGEGALLLCESVRHFFRTKLGLISCLRAEPCGSSNQLHRLVLFLLCAILTLEQSLNAYDRIAHAYFSIRYSIKRHFFVLGPELLAPIANDPKPGNVLYACAAWGMGYSVTHGLENRTAEYFYPPENPDHPPAAVETTARFMIATNPTASFSNSYRQGFRIGNSVTLACKMPKACQVNQISLRIVADNELSRVLSWLRPKHRDSKPLPSDILTIEYLKHADAIEEQWQQLCAVLGQDGWITIPLPEGGIDSFRIRSTKPVWIEGFRLGEKQHLLWPWDSGIVLHFRTLNAPDKRVIFQTTQLAPGLVNRVEVLNDSGYFIPCRLLPPNAER